MCGIRKDTCVVTIGFGVLVEVASKGRLCLLTEMPRVRQSCGYWTGAKKVLKQVPEVGL